MKRSFLVLTLILMWIGLVFYFSSQPPDVSGRQSGNVYKFLKKVDNVLDFTQTRWYKNLRSLLENGGSLTRSQRGKILSENQPILDFTL